MGKPEVISHPATLQVLVSTFGSEGMQRFVRSNPPKVEGVEYVVSWQQPDAEMPVPSVIAGRYDIKVYNTRTRGLTRNRNLAMQAATAPLCLVADDDVIYTPDTLRRVIEEFEKYPEADVICFAYTCKGESVKPYPERVVEMQLAPRGWYATSFEIAYRRESVAAQVRFNENFGIGAPLLQAGEEDIWLYDVRKQGGMVMLSPTVICRHDADTTGERCASQPWFVMTQGAIHSHLHPLTWPLRVAKYSFLQKRINPLRHLYLALRGGVYAFVHGYFRNKQA